MLTCLENISTFGRVKDTTGRNGNFQRLTDTKTKKSCYCKIHRVKKKVPFALIFWSITVPTQQQTIPQKYPVELNAQIWCVHLRCPSFRISNAHTYTLLKYTFCITKCIPLPINFPAQMPRSLRKKRTLNNDKETEILRESRGFYFRLGRTVL